MVTKPILGTTLVLLAAACGVGRRQRSQDAERSGPLVRALAESPTMARPWLPRFSNGGTYAPCGAFTPNRSLRCSPDGTSQVTSVVDDIAAQATAALRAGPDPDALHAAALIDLTTGDTARSVLEQSISYLEMTTRLSPNSASAFIDLSAAQLAYASERGPPTALLAGLDAASRAVDVAPEAPAALYNRALALDLLALDTEAGNAWRAYLAVDSTSGYATEARSRIHALAFHEVAEPDSQAEPEMFARYALLAPGEARVLAWERLLRDWGVATLGGDTARARSRLSEAAAIGRVLATQHGDWSTADATAAIARGTNQPSALRQLALAHVRYAEAQDSAHVNKYPAADRAFLEILAARPPSPALLDWARLGHANALIYRQRPREALVLMQQLLASIDRRRHPGLGARLQWNTAILLLRNLQTDAGLSAITRARALYARAGERENVAGTIGVEAEARLQTGDVSNGYADVYRALAQLRAYPASLWRHDVLLVLARFSARDGFLFAARAVEDEDAAVAGHGSRAVSIVEARLARARSAFAEGDTTAARAAMADATEALATVPDAAARMQLGQDMDLTIAGTLIRTRPDSALAMLDRVVGFFEPLRYPTKLIPALVARAAAALALGRMAPAEADLTSAAAHYDSARVAIAHLAQRSELLAQARAVFDTLVVLRWRDGSPIGALAALEDGRQSFGAARPIRSVGAPLSGSGPVVDYALIGNELLTWVVTGRDTSFRATPVDRARLSRAIEQSRAAMELDAPAAAMASDLDYLYDVLVRPVVPLLGDSGATVAIVPDGELTDVPFAALRDSTARQYLVQRYATRMASTLRDATAPSDTARPSTRAVFVADPALDPRTFPGLLPVRDADQEVRFAAARYPRTRVIAGAAADSATVTNALAGADLFHFAGHAVVNDAEPERSFLAVAPHGLSAAAIARLDLHGLRIAVLSACETMRSPDRRSGGFSGLAEAFLAAGANGVIGSLWQVDDSASSRLMTAFYRSYARGANAPRALRAAQLVLLRDDSLALAPWAAFQYAGH